MSEIDLGETGVINIETDSNDNLRLRPEGAGIIDLGGNTVDGVSKIGNAGSPITLTDDADLAGNALTDTTQGYLDLVGDGNDVRVGTDQSIGDGSGNSRLQVDSTRTQLNFESGVRGIELNDGFGFIFNVPAGIPLQLFDSEGSFAAVNYRTSSTVPGTLELSNALINHTVNVSDTDDSMTANPETDTESGYITVEVNGTQKQIPVYDP